MKQIRVILFLLSICAVNIGAQGSDLAFRSDVDVARALARYVISGKIPVSNTFTFTGNELSSLIGFSNGEADPEGFASRFLFSINPGVIAVSGIDIYSPRPWSDQTLLYFLDTVPVFTELGADFSAGDALSGRVKLDLTMRQTFIGENDLPVFAPWNINSMLRILTSWKFPQEGWVAGGNEHAWIAAGRFKAGLGDGHFGNTFLNSRAEWYDQVQGAVGNENFRFTSLVGTSSTHLYENEAAIQFLDRNVPNLVENSINPWDPVNDHDFGTTMEAVKMFAYSQVETRFWDRFRFGIGQMNMIGGKYPGLADILPTSFWHNVYTAGYTNVMLGLSASVVPIDGLLVFGEFTVDDFTGTDEGIEGKPSQYAWQTGARYSLIPMDDVVLTVGGEYTFASEWVYTRWQPYLTMYQRHLINGSQGTDWPLGFTWGPDANHFGLFANASLESGASVELGYEYLSKGPIYLGMMDADGDPVYYDYDWRTDNTKDTSLAAIRALPDQSSHGVTLKATMPLPRRFEANASLQYWHHTDYRNTSGDTRNFILASAGVLWRY